MDKGTGQYKHYSFRLDLSKEDEQKAYYKIIEMQETLAAEGFTSGVREAIVELIVYPGKDHSPEPLTPDLVEQLVESKLTDFGQWLMQRMGEMNIQTTEDMRPHVPSDTPDDGVPDAFFDSLLNDFNNGR